LNLSPLSNSFGLETNDADVSRPLSGAAFAELERAFFAGQVFVLRDQRLTPQQFVAFAQRLGPPEPHVIDQFHHPVDSNILILSNRKKDGQPIGLADAGTYFHTDYS
jgi:taurine dioxygenase